MRQYETIFLISPNLSEEDTEGIISQMSEVVSKKKGKMISQEKWGKRKLAYPIQKFEEAFYVLFHYEGKHEIPAELERRFKQSDTVIRYLTVKKETRENIRKKGKQRAAEQEIAPPEERVKEEAKGEEEPSPEVEPKEEE